MLLWLLTGLWKATNQRWLSRGTLLLSSLVTPIPEAGRMNCCSAPTEDLGAQAWAADLQLVFIFYLAALASFSD